MAKNASPVGTSVEDDIVDRLARSAEFRDAMDRLRPFEEIAPILILGGFHRSVQRSSHDGWVTP